MTSKEYKKLSVKEFTKAAEIYESDNAGVYTMCKKDYPDVLAELEKEPFTDLLDCGCGTAPMLSFFLSVRYQPSTGSLPSQLPDTSGFIF